MAVNALEDIGRPSVGRWVTAGTIVVAVFLVLFGGWAGFVPLDAAVVAQGSIEAGTKRQLVQHLEGGIVRAIAVREHQPVKRGELLVRFDTTRAQATLDLVTNQYLAAEALVARLSAEQQGAEAIAWPPALQQTEPGIAEIVREETDIFSQRVSVQRGRIDLVENKLARATETVNGAQRQLRALMEQQRIVKKQVELYTVSAQKGAIPRQKLNEQEREMHAIDERLRALETRITAGKHEIEQSRLQLVNQRTDYASEVAEQLHAARLNLSDLAQKHKAASDVLERTDVLSPYDGIVINLRANTLGGVIGSGEPIMELVPADANYRVAARVRPSDIDRVRTGSLARVRLTAYKQRITPSLDAMVEEVSADVLYDEMTGEAYYEALVAIEADALTAHPELQVYPGMPADVMILAESRTMLQYLIQPVLESFSYAFRES